jgi:asparagine synthetase B (glutamine-hydrolysing)
VTGVGEPERGVAERDVPERDVPERDVPEGDVPEGDMAELLGRLKHRLAQEDRLVTAFSGGADSALLAAVAHDVLGSRAGWLTRP